MLMQIIGSGGSFDDLGVAIYTLLIGNFIAPFIGCIVTGAICGGLMPRLGVGAGWNVGLYAGLGTTGSAWVSTLISAWATDGDIEIIAIVLALVAVCGCIVTALLCERRSRKVPESGER
ncbi:MAG: hypothetical protein OXI54_14870 [Chloroflexota bacterium]|nr:hypothetical protein [Chloroflexota bacterium]MDE2685410.1 hypothetical protein [Chloroflexota bacterium]